MMMSTAILHHRRKQERERQGNVWEVLYSFPPTHSDAIPKRFGFRSGCSTERGDGHHHHHHHHGMSSAILHHRGKHKRNRQRVGDDTSQES